MKNKLIKFFITLWYLGFMILNYFDKNMSDRRFLLMGVLTILVYMLILELFKGDE